MTNKHDPMNYEMPWRPNYEAYALLAWLLTAGLAPLSNLFWFRLPWPPYYAIEMLCGSMTLYWFPSAWRLWRMKRHLRGKSLQFESLDAVLRRMNGHSGELWLGYGFDWENRHAQRVRQLLKCDLSRVVPSSPDSAMGYRWLHGLGLQEERPQYQPLKQLEGHTLIVGTSGSGKTRLLDLVITQAVLRHEAVVIIDPKGDRDLRETTRRACEAAGEPGRFVCFHPAYPEQSVRLDPLANYHRVTEIASRLAALVPSVQSGNDPFQSFAWQALNHIAQGLVLIHRQPTLLQLRRYLEGGAAPLVAKAVEAYAKWLDEHKGTDFLAGARQCLDALNVALNIEPMSEPLRSQALSDLAIRQKAEADAWSLAQAISDSETREETAAPESREETLAWHWMAFYHQVIEPHYPKAELEGLLSMYRHDRTHFAKMVASLLPIMNMLTSGDLGPMLSPDRSNDQDPRPVTDTARLIREGQVLYLGLDSLSDGLVGSAIGSLILADLASVAGNRYNFGIDNLPVNVYVDEAAEVVNEPFIQLLNKGRGAGLRLTVATQTYADFAARLGGRDRAEQVLGNLNNLIALRVINRDTQQYIVDNLPKTHLKTVMHTQSQSVSSEDPLRHGGNQGERLIEEEADLFQAPLLGMLPNLEYFACLGHRIVKGRLPILEADLDKAAPDDTKPDNVGNQA